MAEDNNITRIDGELLPATSNLMEVTKALQIANSSFEKSVVSVEKVLPTEDLAVQMDDPFRVILESMDRTLKQISNNIGMFMDGLLNTFFDINQNQIRTIIVQEKLLKLDGEKFTYQKDKDQDERQAESKGTESEGSGSEPKERKGFLGEVDKAQKEFEEKGFLKYVSELIGVDGTISLILNRVAAFAPLVMPLFAGIGAALTSLLTEIGAALTKTVAFVTKSVIPAIIKIGKNLLRVFGRILLPVYAVFNAITGFVEGFTANEDDSIIEKTLRGISRGIEEVINAIVMWPVDMIKDLVSWVAGALGFTQIENFLDSFSFQEGFSELMGTFETWITGIPDRITTWFEETINAISTWFDETLTNIGDFFSPLTEAWTAVTEKISSIGEDLSTFFTDLFDFSKGDFFSPLTEAWTAVTEKISSIGEDLSTFFTDLFDFSKIKNMLTNLFAEIGVPRIEFDLPVVGKVGFGPFYPFMPDANVANLSASESIDTVSTQSSDGSIDAVSTQSSDGSIDTSERTMKSGITSIAGEHTEGEYAHGAKSLFLAKESIDATSGEEITTSKDKEVMGQFDTEAGEGIITYQATDANNELNNIMQEFNVSGITFGQVRRMIDDGASPDEVRMFLENKQKSIFDKIGDFLSSPAETTPIDVAPVETKRMDTANELAVQTAEREETKATQSQQPVNVVNAPTSNVSNVSQSTAFFDTPSAVDGLSMSY